MRGNPSVRIRIAVAAAFLLTGTGGVSPTFGGAAAAAPTGEPCHEHDTAGVAMYTPGEGGAPAPIDPLASEIDGVLDPATMAAAAGLASTPIATWFHVITDGDGTDVTDAQIAEQLAVLNDAFAGSAVSAGTPFSFTHAGTDRTDNPAWYGSEFSNGSQAEAEAKAALRRGTASTLNVYVTDTATGASWGTFPEWYKRRPTWDGIVVDRNVFAGGSSVTHGTGDVAVHEVGHWLGLWHTFQGGCTGGDFVDDTPAQAAASELQECITPQDTCVAPGTDPVHNFMNYLLDACADRFTVGQTDRMKAQWTTYRAATPGKANRRK